MSKKLNLELKPGEWDFYECSQLKTIESAKSRIAEHNRTHETQISYKVMGGGLDLRAR